MTARPGPRNLITDVLGLRLGNAEDAAARTGVTVVLPDRRSVAAVAVLGGAPGTRETELLSPLNLVEAVDALVLSGGSVFGLAAGDAVAQWLVAEGRGLVHGAAPMPLPIVPAAILFDLANGGDKAWGPEPPYRALALRACTAAGLEFALGNAGAGLGAVAGTLKGGLGSTSLVTGDGLTVGALAAVNAVGAAVVPGTGTFWAWMLEQAGELGGQRPPELPLMGLPLDLPPDMKRTPAVGASTTLAVVATDAALTKAEAARVALMAHAGLARAIRPSHTPFDGDLVFALSTAARDLGPARAAGVLRIGHLASDCLARAVARGVFAAEQLGGWPAYRAVHAGAFGP